MKDNTMTNALQLILKGINKSKNRAINQSSVATDINMLLNQGSMLGLEKIANIYDAIGNTISSPGFQKIQTIRKATPAITGIGGALGAISGHFGQAVSNPMVAQGIPGIFQGADQASIVMSLDKRLRTPRIKGLPGSFLGRQKLMEMVGNSRGAVDLLMAQAGAIGGVGRTFSHASLNGQELKGLTGDKLELLTRHVRTLESRELSLSSGMGLKLPGYHGHSAGDSPVAKAFGGLLSAMEGAGFRVSGSMSNEGIISLSGLVTRPGSPDYGKTLAGIAGTDLTLSLGFGGIRPVLPKFSGISHRTEQATFLHKIATAPGTQLDTIGGRASSTFGIQKAVAIVRPGSRNMPGTISEIVPGSVFYLNEMAEMFRTGSVTPKNVKSLNKLYNQLATYADEDVGKSVAAMHDVVPIMKTSKGYHRVVKEALSVFPDFYKKGDGYTTLDLTAPAFAKYTKAYEEIRAMGAQKGLSTSTVKAEAAFEHGMMSTLTPANYMPFGMFEDPARYIRQYGSTGRFAGGKYFDRLREARGGALSRLTTPILSTSYQHAVELKSLFETGVGTRLNVNVGLIQDPMFLMSSTWARDPKIAGLQKSFGQLDFAELARAGRSGSLTKSQIKGFTSLAGRLLGHARSKLSPADMLDITTALRNPTQLIQKLEKEGGLGSFEYLNNLRTLAFADKLKQGAPVFDAPSGGIWVSQAFMEAHSKDITRQLNPTDSKHQKIAKMIKKKGSFGLLTSDGQRLLEEGGIGTHIMIGRGKFTISGVYDEKKMAQAFSGARVPDVLMPQAALAKYPGMLAETAFNTTLSKAFKNTLGAGDAATRERHLKAYHSIAKKMGGEFVMMAGEKAAARTVGQGPAIPERVSRLVRRPLDNKIFTPNEFDQFLAEGFHPHFKLDDVSSKVANATKFEDVTNLLNSLKPELKELGVDSTIPLERLVAPLGSASGAAGITHGYSVVMQSALRPKSYNLMAKFNPVVPGRVTLHPDGFKLQQAGLRRLGTWGPEGKALAAALVDEAIGGKKGTAFLRSTEAFSQLAEGFEVHNSSNMKKYKLDEFVKKARSILQTTHPERYKAGESIDSTYFSKEMTKAFGESFIIETDQPIEWTRATAFGNGTNQGDKFQRKQFFFFGQKDAARQIKSNSPLTPVLGAEEGVIRTLLQEAGENGELTPQAALSLERNYRKYESAVFKSLVSKSGSLANKVIQPRLGGSMWTSIIEGSLDPDTVAKYGRGWVRVSPDAAARLKLDKLIAAQGSNFAYALTERAPIQGAGNQTAVKVFIDKTLKGFSAVYDPLVYRYGIGDTDQDVMSSLFASTMKLRKRMEALHKVQYSPQAVLRHTTSLVALDHAMREASLVSRRGEIDLFSMWKTLEKYDKPEHGKQNVKSFATANRLLAGLQASVDGDPKDFLNLQRLRIDSTKLATGPVHNAHELLRTFSENSGFLDSFAGASGLTAAEVQMYHLQASGVFQTAEELASIKKASAPVADLLAHIQEFAINPLQKGTQEHVAWHSKMGTILASIQEEVWGGKGMGIDALDKIRSEHMHDSAIQRAKAAMVNLKLTASGYDTEALARALQNSEGIKNMSFYMESLARHMNTVSSGHVNITAAISPMAKVMGRRMRGKKTRQQALAVKDALAAIRQAQVHVQNSEDAVSGSAKLIGKAIEATIAAKTPLDTVYSGMAPEVAQSVAQSTSISGLPASFIRSNQASEIGEELFSSMMHFIKRNKPAVSIGAGILGLAAIKNLLFPNVVPDMTPEQKYRDFQNPPMFGYNTSQGVDAIPDITFGKEDGMMPAQAPSYGNSIGLPSHMVSVGQGMSSEGQIAMVGSPLGMGGSPMQPVSSMQGAPEIDTSAFVSRAPTARVETPMYSTGRHLGAYATAPGVEVEVDGDYGMRDSVALGAQIGMMSGAPTSVSISSADISQSRLEMLRSVSDSQNSRFYFGSTDVGGDLA